MTSHINIALWCSMSTNQVVAVRRLPLLKRLDGQSRQADDEEYSEYREVHTPIMTDAVWHSPNNKKHDRCITALPDACPAWYASSTALPLKPDKCCQ